MTEREIYQLYYNKAWIENLDGQEIAYFDTDSLENQWMLYKPKYTDSATSSDRLKTQKNRIGDILLRKKNKPIGFKLNSSTETDVDGEGRKYQAQVLNATLGEVLDGNVYDLKLYGNYGTVFGKDDVGTFYAFCFKISGVFLNLDDEEFVTLTVVTSVQVDDLYNFVDCIISNNNFFVITHNGATILTTSKYNIPFGIDEGSEETIFSTSSFDATSENDLLGLSYTQVSSRVVTINSIPTETIGRIWTTSYSDDKLFLAYECNVPTVRSDVTGVTEGIALIEVVLDVFLESGDSTLTYYMYDTLTDLPKVADEEYCQAFIPDYLDERQSFGHSITTADGKLVVGSPEEDAIYVFPLDETVTPDLFGAETTTLPSNGVKILKDFSLEQAPVFPIRMQGVMDFEIFGDVDIIWANPDGSTQTGSQATGFLGSVDTFYLFCDNFLNGDVTINANLTSGFIGSLNDIPNLSFGLDVSNTMASGHFGDDFQATQINIENTDVSQGDLDLSLMVLDDAGNVSGTIYAASGLPDIISDNGIGAVNALRAKDWNVDVNMSYDDIDPSFVFEVEAVGGSLDPIAEIGDDFFSVSAVPTDGDIEWIVPDNILVSGAQTAIVNSTYALNGAQSGKPKWTNISSPFNDLEFNSQWDIMHETPVSGTYYTNPGTDYLPDTINWAAGNIGLIPAPTLVFQYS